MCEEDGLQMIVRIICPRCRFDELVHTTLRLIELSWKANKTTSIVEVHADGIEGREESGSR